MNIHAFRRWEPVPDDGYGDNCHHWELADPVRVRLRMPKMVVCGKRRMVTHVKRKEQSRKMADDQKVRPVEDDPVNHPAHYTRGGIECIDAIKASMSPEAFHGFLQGNAMKYIWRHDLKGKPVEDLDKAMWYLTRLRNEIKP